MAVIGSQESGIKGRKPLLIIGWNRTANDDGVIHNYATSDVDVRSIKYSNFYFLLKTATETFLRGKYILAQKTSLSTICIHVEVSSYCLPSQPLLSGLDQVNYEGYL